MQRTPTSIVRKPLQQIRNIHKHGSGDWNGWLELACMKGVDFQSTDAVLEKQRAQAEVCMRYDSGVAFLLQDLAFDLGIVQNAHLRVRMRRHGIEEVFTEIQRDGEAF